MWSSHALPVSAWVFSRYSILSDVCLSVCLSVYATPVVSSDKAVLHQMWLPSKRWWLYNHRWAQSCVVLCQPLHKGSKFRELCQKNFCQCRTNSRHFEDWDYDREGWRFGQHIHIVIVKNVGTPEIFYRKSSDSMRWTK